MVDFRRIGAQIRYFSPILGDVFDAAQVRVHTLLTTPERVDRLRDDLASKIDHTLLKPDATAADIEKLCAEAKQFRFATVCINPCRVALAARLLEGTSVLPIAVIGFPLGASTTPIKMEEARNALALGAREIDMVINVGWLKEGNRDTEVERDIRSVVQVCKPYPVKVILETGFLTSDEIVRACHLAKSAGAAFVKTSTGFGPRGASVQDVTLMRQTVGPDMGVKASGGIRSRADALKMLEAGATRLGTSAGVMIVATTSESTASY